jgi:competence protein ComEA
MKNTNSFYISKHNKKGVSILICICLVIVFIPRIILSLKEKEEFVLSSEDIQYISENKLLQKHKRHSNYFNPSKEKRFKRPPSKFDPNNYTISDWMKLGLSEKQAMVVINFSKRGLYSNEQLKKIFVISNELFELIKDSTIYPIKYPVDSPVEKVENIKKTVEIIGIDVNSATQSELETIKGIGPFFAKNILKYRDKLGGFCKKEQLLEVWKMDQEKYNQIEPYITIDAHAIRKINVNTATAEELKSFPYFNWNIANSIVKMRIQKGSYQSINQLKESELIDEELFDKIKQYLSL